MMNAFDAALTNTRTKSFLGDGQTFGEVVSDR